MTYSKTILTEQNLDFDLGLFAPGAIRTNEVSVSIGVESWVFSALCAILQFCCVCWCSHCRRLVAGAVPTIKSATWKKQLVLNEIYIHTIHILSWINTRALTYMQIYWRKINIFRIV